MRLCFAPLLLLPYLASAARFHYGAECTGDDVEFTFSANNRCVGLTNGYAKSMYWSDPGQLYYAVAYKENSNSDCGKEVCNLNALQSKTCCNSGGGKKNIKGAERFRIPQGARKRSTSSFEDSTVTGGDVEDVEGSYEGCTSVWELGAVLRVAVGDRMIGIPNHNSSMPTASEVRDVLVNAGVADVEVHMARVSANLDL